MFGREDGCLIRKESACLNNHDLAIPIQDSET